MDNLSQLASSGPMRWLWEIAKRDPDFALKLHQIGERHGMEALTQARAEAGARGIMETEAKLLEWYERRTGEIAGGAPPRDAIELLAGVDADLLARLDPDFRALVTEIMQSYEGRERDDLGRQTAAYFVATAVSHVVAEGRARGLVGSYSEFREYFYGAISQGAPASGNEARHRLVQRLSDAPPKMRLYCAVYTGAQYAGKSDEEAQELAERVSGYTSGALRTASHRARKPKPPTGKRRGRPKKT